MRRQGREVEDVLRRAGCGSPARVLDCSCGIGTQALGLASRGFEVVGTDLSSKAIERARREAARLGLTAQFEVADMRSLPSFEGASFEAVISFDNSLPHLLTDQDLATALAKIRDSLTPGGTFAASIRDYDSLRESRPTSQSFRVMPHEDCQQRVSFQLWNWHGDDMYDVTQFVLAPSGEQPDEWTTTHATCRYRALKRSELSAALAAAGFVDVEWYDDAFYQPVVVSRRPS